MRLWFRAMLKMRMNVCMFVECENIEYENVEILYILYVTV